LSKERILGISVGMLSFLFIFLILNFNVDFDHELINKLDDGTPKEIMILEIENQTEKEQLTVKKHLKCHIMDITKWDKCNCDFQNDLKYDILVYKTDMSRIKQKEEIRKKFARKEITKEQFLNYILKFKTFK
jgi:hypothetical protein